GGRAPVFVFAHGGTVTGFRLAHQPRLGGAVGRVEQAAQALALLGGELGQGRHGFLDHGLDLRRHPVFHIGGGAGGVGVVGGGVGCVGAGGVVCRRGVLSFGGEGPLPSRGICARFGLISCRSFVVLLRARTPAGTALGRRCGAVDRGLG